nr:hypothetical protein [Flavonifractor sp. An135]
MDKRMEDLAGALRVLRSAVHATELDLDGVTLIAYESRGESDPP